VETPQIPGGRYQPQDRLDSGGVSVVWRAHDRVLGQDVAIKFLTGSYSTGAFARERIQAEARTAAGMRHPAVVNVLDHGETAGKDGEIIPFIVMELAPGRTLAGRLSEGPLPPEEALRICADVASALAAAHAIGLVHRDVKPGNVMLTPSGAKVFDFGIAALIGGPEVTSDEPDTSAFLAPERLTENTVIPPSDVYALGLLLHRTLTGELPWNAETSARMFAEHTYIPPAPLPDIEGVDAAVTEACARCLAEEPLSRPSAGEVAALLADAAGVVSIAWDVPPAVPVPVAETPVEALPPRTAEILPAEPVPAPAPMGDPPDTDTRPRRRTAVLALISALVVAMAVGVVIMTHHGASSPRAAGVPALSGARLPSASTAAAPTDPGTPAPSSTPATTRATPSSAPHPHASKPASMPKTHSSTTTSPPHTKHPPASPPASPPSSPPVTSGGPVDSAGGSIDYTCTGDDAVIQSAAPNLGWTISEYDPGPSADVKVVFVSLLNTKEIDVHCSQGKATTKVK